MLAYREMSDEALVVPVMPPVVLVRLAARVLIVRALVAFVTLVLEIILGVVAERLAAVLLLCVCCVCNHTLAESKGCPTRVPVIPAAYPATMEFRTEVEDHEVLAVEPEVIVDADIAEGCIEAVAIVV